MNRLSIIAARHRLGDLATSSSGNVGAHGGWFCYRAIGKSGRRA
jgi:hypothetical protein